MSTAPTTDPDARDTADGSPTTLDADGTPGTRAAGDGSFGEATWQRLGHLAHEVARQASGQVDDDVLAVARDWIADRRLEDALRALCTAIVVGDGALGEEVAMDVTRVLNAVRPGAGDRSVGAGSGLQGLGPDSLVDALFAFGVARRPDVPVRHHYEGSDDDAIASAVATAMDGRDDVLLAWHADRRPLFGAPHPPRRPVVVVEAGVEADLPAITVDLHRVLRDEGVDVPVVEVHRAGQPLTTVSTSTLSCVGGDPTWAATPPEEPGMVAVFPQVVDGEGYFPDGHPVLDADDRAEVADWLDECMVLAYSAGNAVDVVDGSGTVPTGLRLVGPWVFGEATTHYLRRHGLAPPADFLDWVQAVDGPPPPVDSVSLAMAMDLVEGDGPDLAHDEPEDAASDDADDVDDAEDESDDAGDER